MTFAPLGGKGASHRPVLLRETVETLEVKSGGLFIDCTVGLGGHAEAILRTSDHARVLGIDRDREALVFASKRLVSFHERFRAVHGNFRDLPQILKDEGETNAAGILVDLGVSSLQLESTHRGFSFRREAPLDMRMDAESSDETVADLLGRLSEEEIAHIIFTYGEERHSRRIARSIVERRDRNEPIETTLALAELVARATGYKKGRATHPATRTFQALRIAVNSELDGLGDFIEAAINHLQPEGRLVSISFHSLEDRIIKQTLRRLSGRCECPPRIPSCRCGARRLVEIVTKRPVTPSAEETDENPRARSAKMRVCRKLS